MAVNGQSVENLIFSHHGLSAINGEKSWPVITKETVMMKVPQAKKELDVTIKSLAVNGQSFLVIDGYLLNPLLILFPAVINLEVARMRIHFYYLHLSRFVI